MAREFKDITLNFDSLAEFSRHIAAGKTQPVFKNSVTSTVISDYRTIFTGTTNFEEAEKLLKDGDPESMKLLKKYGFEPSAKKYNFGQRRKITPAVVGFAPIVPNAIAGVPVAMQQIKMQQAKTKVVNVVLSVAYDWSVKKEEFAEYAAQTLNGCLTMEKRGIRVNLFVFAGWKGRKNKRSFDYQHMTVLVKIKDSKQAIDPLSVAYPVINSSFMRRHCMRLMEITPGLCDNYNVAHGYVMHDIKDIKNSLPKALQTAETIVTSYYIKDKLQETFAGVK